MNIVDKYEMLDELESSMPAEGTEEYRYWENTYNFIYSWPAIANPVLDSKKFRSSLLVKGFSFEEIKTIMKLVHEHSCNKDFLRTNITLEMPMEER